MSQLTKVREGKNFCIFKDQKGNKLIRIDNVRASYPFVGNQADDEDDNGNPTPKWRINGLLPKDTHVDAKNAVKSIIEELMKTNEVTIPGSHWFLTNGDEKEDENAKGHWVVSASDSKIRPAVRNRDNELIQDADEADRLIYAGCNVDILLRPWYFDGISKKSNKKLPKRIVSGLVGVKFAGDNKPFGNARIDDSDAWGNSSSSSSGDGMDDNDL